MTEKLKHEELNTAIDSIIAGGEFASTGDEGVDAAARLATGLRGLGDPDFKARLRAELLPETHRTLWSQVSRGVLARAVGLPGFSWLRGQRAFLAAGGSSGVVAGACCLSGAAASVLGIASAVAVRDFIDSTLPYFVALSIAGIVGWLLWWLRDQGLTLTSVAQTLRRHGVALAGSYGTVFGASMTLAMLMGLY